jgi:hypothetical protein
MKLRAKIKQPNLGEKQKGDHQKQNADPMESIHFCVIVPAAGRRRCRVQASNVVMYGHKHSGGKTIMAAQIIIEVRRRQGSLPCACRRSLIATQQGSQSSRVRY